jgi:flagellar motor switch/type III secretory pathway protein FliN
MFNAFKFEDIREISERDFFRANSFLSMNPLSWSNNFLSNWQNLLKKFKLNLEGIKTTPEYKPTYSKIIDGSSFCFYADEVECFFHVPEDSQNRLQKLLNLESSKNKIFSSVAVEYFLRKLLSDFISNWKGDSPFKIRFVGLDIQSDFEKLDLESIRCDIILNNNKFEFYLLLSGWVIEKLEMQFQPVSSVRYVPEDFEDKFLLSYVLSSKIIPTNQLIEIVRKGTIIELPQTSISNPISVIVNNKQVVKSTFSRLSDSLVVEFLEEVQEEEQIIKREQSLLTISLGSRHYDSIVLKENPRILEIEDSNFPEVEIMISNEIVAKGVLGFYEESGTLAVKVV